MLENTTQTTKILTVFRTPPSEKRIIMVDEYNQENWLKKRRIHWSDNWKPTDEGQNLALQIRAISC